MPELKMLVDAVSSSRIIPAKSSEELIKKIGSMASFYQRKDLSLRIFISDRIKASNKKRILKNNGEVYFCS